MTSPLPPRLRDTTSFLDRVRQDRTNLGQLGVGFMGGRFPPLRPLGSAALLGDLEDDGSEAETIFGEDRDRLRLGALDTQVWTLLATPIDRTLVVRFHPDGGAGVEWKRGEHYTLNDNVVTIRDTALAAAGAAVDDVLSAQYLRVGEELESYTIDFASDGWSYLALPGSPDDNSTDYSLAAFATWPTGQTPIGNVGSVAGGGPVNTHLDTELMWAARQVGPASSMTISVRVEDNCKVYVNGTLVGSIAEQGSGSAPETTFEVPPSALNSDVANVIAVRVADETPIVTANISFDASIIATASES